MHPDDLAALAALIADELADRVRAELDTGDRRGGSVEDGFPQSWGRQGSRLLDAAEVARKLGVTRDAVYRQADRLGVIRIGDGPKARLRFDAKKVAAALDAYSTGREPSAPNPRPPRSRRRQTSNIGPASPLLPVRGL
jgi:hypothetical protein